MKLILASQSPRRKALLSQLGFTFAVVPSNYDEEMHLALSPKKLVMHLSRQKAENVAARYPQDVIVGADTIVVIGGEILGKAHTQKDVTDMLGKLSGKKHAVVTGLTIIFPSPHKPHIFSTAVSSDVYFRPLSSSDIDWYIKTEEPFEKAGAYAIQGLGAVFIQKIHGNFNAIVGLPLDILYEKLSPLFIHHASSINIL